MSYQFPETPAAQGGWAAYQHPEGALYFVHSESKTFTEVDVRDEEFRHDIEYFRDYLYSELETEIMNRNLSGCLKVDEVQLVLEPMVDELGSVACYYYFVNPRNRSIFWLSEWEGESIFKYSKGILSPPHKGLGIQAEYWSHWAVYPNFCDITQELKDEVVGMILHARCDHLTSRNRSSCPLNTEELKEHLSLVERIDQKLKHSAIIIGRIMHIFYCARLNSDQAIHGWRYHPSLRMKTCAPLLFMLPVDNVRLLHSIFIDEIASKEKWNMFVTKLNSQLQETSVLATVLLNANVSFLQVAETSGTGTSPQEFLSYMSLVTSMASIILSLVFMGHSRTEARGTAFKAAKFLSKLRHERHGLETLAIVYSLPPAFLMWGMCLFSAAFATQWCYPDHATLRACAGASMFMVALLVAWCIWIARDRRTFWWFQPDPVQGIQAELQESEDDGVMEI
ncbi:hypothetical protein HD554DRAFT_723979 [Boletus coccyginus]|nr:hypothetical protein HD554DRAFT_723979 [Boletus coccyginus]